MPSVLYEDPCTCEVTIMQGWEETIENNYCQPIKTATGLYNKGVTPCIKSCTPCCSSLPVNIQRPYQPPINIQPVYQPQVNTVVYPQSNISSFPPPPVGGNSNWLYNNNVWKGDSPKNKQVKVKYFNRSVKQSSTPTSSCDTSSCDTSSSIRNQECEVKTPENNKKS